MELFQLIRSKFAVLGIVPSKSTQTYRKLVMVYFIYGFIWTSSSLFLYKKANTFEEYTNNIYVTSATAMILASFTVVVSKISRFFKFLDNYGRTVERGNPQFKHPNLILHDENYIIGKYFRTELVRWRKDQKNLQ